MREIQNAHRVVAMAIDKALQPVGPILHGRHLFGSFHASSTHFDGSQIGKGGRIHETRKVGMGLAANRPVFVLWADNFSNHQRFDFGPDPTPQRHHPPITTHEHALSRCFLW